VSTQPLAASLVLVEVDALDEWSCVLTAVIGMMDDAGRQSVFN
jgi:hypothetical protein